MKRLTQQREITIWRDDHIGDPLSAIFLDASPAAQDSILQVLHEYLGPRVRILRVDLTAVRLNVLLEIRAFGDEALRLAATAKNLQANGAPRNALALFREAAALDPMSQTVAMGIGILMAELGHHSEALATLKRAREYGPENADLLYALGQTALTLERTASAIVYFERAFELAPHHFGARRALTALGRKPKPPARIQPPGSRSSSKSSAVSKRN